MNYMQFEIISELTSISFTVRVACWVEKFLWIIIEYLNVEPSAQGHRALDLEIQKQRETEYFALLV